MSGRTVLVFTKDHEMGVVSGDQRCSEVLPEFSLYHGTYHKMPIVGKHLITHWIWDDLGIPWEAKGSTRCRCLHFLVHNLLERSVGSPSMLVCVGVSLFEGWVSCLTCEVTLSCRAIEENCGNFTAAKQTFPMKPNGKLLKLSKGRAEGQPWICFFDLGLGGQVGETNAA